MHENELQGAQGKCQTVLAAPAKVYSGASVTVGVLWWEQRGLTIAEG